MTEPAVPEHATHGNRVRAERTAFAWLRTGVSITAVGFLIGRLSALTQRGRIEPVTDAMTTAAGALTLVVGAVVSLLSVLRYGQELRGEPGSDLAGRQLTAIVIIVGVSMAIVSTLLAVLLTSTFWR